MRNSIGSMLIWGVFLASAMGQKGETLLDARGDHKTELIEQKSEERALNPPPEEVFKIVKYKSDLGPMQAYLSQVEDTSQKLPAMIWLTGGFPVSSPGEYLWGSTSVDNEQSARIYRLSGMVMMYPTLRGGVAGNPGVQETFYGEVNDVIAAHRYLSSLEHVDPERIYLGGHSTGGTLALLVAEATDVFAGVISLGPTANDYGQRTATYKFTKEERALRAPIKHVAAIRTPTYVIEGEEGNVRSLKMLKAASKNPNLVCIEVLGADHFQLIHPVNELIAHTIMESKKPALKLDEKAVANSYVRFAEINREAEVLEEIADARRGGVALDESIRMVHEILGAEEHDLVKAALIAKQMKYKVSDHEERTTEDGSTYYVMTIEKKLRLMDLEAVFALRKAIDDLCDQFELYYRGWSVNPE